MATITKKKRKHHNQEDDHEINIHLLDPEGKELLKRGISLHPRKKVEELFRCVSQLLGITPVRQRLIFNGKELDPNLRLEDAIVDPDGHHVENCAVTLEIDEESRYIVTASVDRTAILWSVETGEQIRLFKGHINSINTVAFSSDGFLIATAADDHTVRIWSAITGQSRHQLCGHEWAVNSAAWAPDDHFLVTSSYDKTVKVWRLASEFCTKTMHHAGPCTSGVFTKDQQSVLSASHDKTAAIWCVETGEKRVTFKGHKDMLFTAVFSRDESAVLTSSGDRTARLWDAADGHCLRVFRGDHRGCVISASFDIEETSVATICEDHLSGRLFDKETGEWSHLVNSELPGKRPSRPGQPFWESCSKKVGNFTNHAAPFNSVSYDWDGKTVLTASIDRTAKLFDTKTGELIRCFRGHGGGVTSTAWLPVEVPTIPEPPPEAPEDKEFHIHLDTSKGAHHGLGFQPDESGKRLVINTIDGLAKQWNMSHPYLKIELGDFIITANGIEDDSRDLLAAMEKRQVLELTILREVCLDFEWEVVFDTFSGQDVGAETEDADTRLRVITVYGGLLENHNKVNDNVFDCLKQVLAGDYIVEVNGVRDDLKLLKSELAKKSKELSVKFFREAPKDLYWDIVLDYSPADAILGMELANRDHKSVLIKSLPEHGGKSVVEAWNVAHPEGQLQVGDVLIEVNGQRNRHDMRHTAEHHQMLYIRVFRQMIFEEESDDEGHSHHDLCTDSEEDQGDDKQSKEGGEDIEEGDEGNEDEEENEEGVEGNE